MGGTTTAAVRTRAATATGNEPPPPLQVSRPPEVLKLAAALAGAARLGARTALETFVQFSSADLCFWSHMKVIWYRMT